MKKLFPFIALGLAIGLITIAAFGENFLHYLQLHNFSIPTVVIRVVGFGIIFSRLNYSQVKEGIILLFTLSLLSTLFCEGIIQTYVATTVGYTGIIWQLVIDYWIIFFAAGIPVIVTKWKSSKREILNEDIIDS